MGLARLAGEQARIAGADFDVEVWLGDDDAQLIEIAVDEKHCEAGQPRYQATGRHAGGDAHHVLFGYAHLQKVVRALFRDDVGLRRVGQVTVEDIGARISIDQFDKSVAEDVTLGDELIGDDEVRHQRASSCAASSCRARRKSSSVTGRECQL